MTSCHCHFYSSHFHPGCYANGPKNGFPHFSGAFKIQQYRFFTEEVEEIACCMDVACVASVLGLEEIVVVEENKNAGQV